MGTESESVPLAWKFTAVMIRAAKLYAANKLQFIEPSASSVWVSPSALSACSCIKCWLAPDGMFGQKVAKLARLPTSVAKKNPVASTTPSGSMCLETSQLAKEFGKNEMQVSAHE